MTRLGDGTDWPAIAPNATDLPYEVRPRGWFLWLSVAFFGLMGIGGIGLAVGIWWSGSRNIGRMIAAAIFLGFGLMFTLCIRFLNRPSHVVYADRIETFGASEVRSLNRSAIEGAELVQEAGVTSIQLKPKDAHAKPIKIDRSALSDPVVTAWLSGIRNLTAEARQRSEAEVLSDTQFGVTKEERASRLARARLLARGLYTVSLGVYIWVLVHPAPYLWAVGTAAALPLAAMVLVWTSGGLIVWSNDRATALPAVLGVAIGGITLLSLRAILDIRLLDWALLLGASAAVGIVTSVLLISRAATKPKPVWLALLFAAILPAAYTYGLAAEANTIFDKSRAEIFPVRVSAKSISTGQHTSYELNVGSWGGRPAGTISVSRRIYDATSVNSTVCVYRHAGWLRLRWYFANHCNS